MTGAEQAQFDWVTERLKDPDFEGLSTSDGEYFSAATLRAIKDGRELMRLLGKNALPLIPVSKTGNAVAQ